MSRTAPPGRSRRRLLPVVLPSILALALSAGCRGGAADTGAVEEMVRREVAAVNARDMQALSQVWSQGDDILLFDVAPPGRFQGWPAIARSFNDLFLRVTDLTMAVENLQVRVDGALAAATYDWTLAGTLDGRALSDRGQATALYRREKDGWRLVHAHYSPAPRGAATGAASGAAEGAGAAAGGAAGATGTAAGG